MEDSVKKIPLTQGLVTLVDAAEYDYLAQWKWCAQKANDKYYALRAAKKEGNQTCVSLHREVLKLHEKDYVIIKHLNGDGLDNRLSNLRVLTINKNKLARLYSQEEETIGKELIRLGLEILEEKKVEIDHLKKQRLKVAQMLMGAIKVTRDRTDAEILVTQLEEILYALRP